MIIPLTGLILCLPALVQPEAKAEYGYFWQPAFALDTIRRSPAVTYEPRPGDLILCNSRQAIWRMSYRLALSSPPTHAALVFRRTDGKLGVVEIWVDPPWNVQITPLSERLADYDGIVYVRRRKTPLTDEASARLTEFAQAVEGKRIAGARLYGQTTPFRARGPLRIAYLGKPQGIREAYFCSELVVEALVHAGVLDAETARPSATYPYDLFWEQSTNAYLNRHLSTALNADWDPPALWTVSD